MAINDIDKLRSAYARFQRDPLARFIVNLRRTRAGQLRALLADPGAQLDLDTFEREVWRIEYHTYLKSRKLELQFFYRHYEQTQLLKMMAEQHLTLSELEKALSSGDLELHGNYIFGQPSAIFAPMIKDQALRLSLLQQALRLFNNATLTPLEQVQCVHDIKGFGENNATGLGMIFHPASIGLVNGASRDILQKMGHAAASKQTWQELQDVLRSLHIVLRTHDFIELDWFLYLYGRSLAPVEPRADMATSPASVSEAANRVVVVAARQALDEYLKYAVYICQPHRPFQPSERMAFYSNNKINRHIPRILARVEAIARDEIETRADLSAEERAGLRTLLRKMDRARRDNWGKHQYDIFFLTPPDSAETLILPQDIENDSTSQTSNDEKRVAFTQKQRYISLSSLEKGPRYTSDLENAASSSDA
ncbi:MAG: hypothetical protein NVS4B9_30700 [Ktedonobacteraceae bacterium]